MRFLILETDYPDFLSWLYADHPGLEKESYDEQMRLRYDSLFGIANFYSRNLRTLGHEAFDVYANNEFMQKAWASEHEIRVEGPAPVLRGGIQQARRIARRTPLRRLSFLFRPVLRSVEAWFYDILASQIKHFEPDVLLNQDMHTVSGSFLKEMKSHVRLLVGQNSGAPLPDSVDLSCYDLAVSSFPPMVKWFQAKGVNAEFHRLGFEPEVLQSLRPRGSPFDVTFVGSFHKIHAGRVALLNDLCSHFEQLRIWGSGVDHMPSTSPIRRHYMGEAWGRQMYQILHDSKITLNYHGDIGPYGGNLRWFEATGVGTLLITDWKMNLRDVFEPGKELVTYRSPEECIQLIEYYLKNDREREDIARAGQQRTLREHTYYQRMQELLDIINKYL